MLSLKKSSFRISAVALAAFCLGYAGCSLSALSQTSGSAPQPELRIEKIEVVDLKTGKREASARSRRGVLSSPHDTRTPQPLPLPQPEFAVKIENGTVHLIKAETGELIRVFAPPTDKPGTKAKAAALSPNDKFVAAYFHLRAYPNTQFDAIHIYDLTTNQTVKVLQANVYTDIRFSPKSTLLAFTSKYGVGTPAERTIAEVWEVGSWVRRIAIDPPPNYKGISSLDVSPDDKLIALGGNGKFGIYSIPSQPANSIEPQRVNPIISQLHSDPNRSVASILLQEVSDVRFSQEGELLFLFTLGEDGKQIKWALRKD